MRRKRLGIGHATARDPRLWFAQLEDGRLTDFEKCERITKVKLLTATKDCPKCLGAGHRVDKAWLKLTGQKRFEQCTCSKVVLDP